MPWVADDLGRGRAHRSSIASPQRAGTGSMVPARRRRTARTGTFAPATRGAGSARWRHAWSATAPLADAPLRCRPRRDRRGARRVPARGPIPPVDASTWPRQHQMRVAARERGTCWRMNTEAELRKLQAKLSPTRTQARAAAMHASADAEAGWRRHHRRPVVLDRGARLRRGSVSPGRLHARTGARRRPVRGSRSAPTRAPATSTPTPPPSSTASCSWKAKQSPVRSSD